MPLASAQPYAALTPIMAAPGACTQFGRLLAVGSSVLCLALYLLETVVIVKRVLKQPEYLADRVRVFQGKCNRSAAHCDLFPSLHPTTRSASHESATCMMLCMLCCCCHCESTQHHRLQACMHAGLADCTHASYNVRSFHITASASLQLQSAQPLAGVRLSMLLAA